MQASAKIQLHSRHGHQRECTRSTSSVTHPPKCAVGHACHCLQQAGGHRIAGKLGWIGIRGAAAAPGPQGEVGDLGRKGWGWGSMVVRA